MCFHVGVEPFRNVCLDAPQVSCCVHRTCMYADGNVDPQGAQCTMSFAGQSPFPDCLVTFWPCDHPVSLQERMLTLGEHAAGTYHVSAYFLAKNARHLLQSGRWTEAQKFCNCVASGSEAGRRRHRRPCLAHDHALHTQPFLTH